MSLKINSKKNVVFEATIVRVIHISDEFSVYACEVDKNLYTNIAMNKYGNTSISGNIQELAIGAKYQITGTTESTKYGIGYKVINIKRSIVNQENYDYRDFLEEFLTYSQADTLLSVYPDIVNRIMTNRLEDIDLSKTKGIKEKTFEIIKDKVITNFKLADLVNEFKGVFSISIIKKLYDQYTSVEQIKNKLHEVPYSCLTNIGGIGFITADVLLLQINKQSKKNIEKGLEPIIDFKIDLLTSSQRMLACMEYILQENETNGNTHMNIKEFKDEYTKLTPECTSHILNILNDKDNNIYFNKEQMAIALKHTYETEEYIANTIKKALSEPIIWKCDKDKYREAEGLKLTDEQLLLLDKLSNNNIVILNGFSGSGKSSSTKALIKYLQDEDKSFDIACPTARAAQVISGYTNQPAKTIHRLLGFMPPNLWAINENNKLESDLLLIDETSMCDIYIFTKLLKSIDFKKTKLVLVGDSFQLPSIGAGNVFHDLIKSKLIPKVELTKVFRYGEGGITTVATDTRNSTPFIPKGTKEPISFGHNKDYTFIPLNKNQTLPFISKLYGKLLKEGNSVDDIIITSAYNKGDMGTDALNNIIQNIANPLKSQSDVIQYGNIEFRKNDIVMNIVNDYKAEIHCSTSGSEPTTLIANGEIGKIIEVNNNSLIIKFGNKNIYYEKNKFKMLKLAYAIGTHKLQGGQGKNIIVVSPSAHTYMLSSNLLYVAITRATKRVYHIGDTNAINRAVLKKDNYDRKTFLCNLLKNN